MMKRTAMAVSIIVCLASPLWAAIEPGTWNFTPFGGGYLFDGDEHLDTGLLFGAKLGYDFTKYFGLETHLGGLRTHADSDYGDIGVKMAQLRLDSLIYFMPESAFVPFFSLGIGGRDLSAGNQHDAAGVDPTLTAQDWSDFNRNADRRHFLVNYGIGAKLFLAKWVALRADVRHVLPLNDTLNNFEATLGLNFVFGSRPAPAPVVEEPAPAPAPVAEEPAPAPVVEPTPAPAPAPVPTVMEKTILEKGRATLDVKFKTNSAVLLPESNKDLVEFADVMQKHPELKAEIAGYTDSVGDATYNKRLSQKRAESVKKNLVEKQGIDAQRLTAKGYGKENPIADNKTKVGRAKNRRVEAVVEYTVAKKVKVSE